MKEILLQATLGNPQIDAIVQKVLQVEQHFMAHYKAYLLEQLRSTEPEHVRIAASFQEQVPLDDEEVIAALQMPD